MSFDLLRLRPHLHLAVIAASMFLVAATSRSAPVEIQVNPENANFYLQAIDMDLPWAGPEMVIRRAYNSRSTMVGPLGPGWSLSFFPTLIRKGLAEVTIVDWDGRETSYAATGRSSARLLAPSRSSGWVEFLPDGGLRRTLGIVQETFDGTGRLSSIRDRHGRILRCDYRAGRLDTVTDRANRVIRFTWSPTGRVQSIRDTAGREVHLGYDARGRLTQFRDVLGADWQYGYDDHDNLVVLRYPSGAELRLTYETSRDWLTALEGPEGLAISYAYQIDEVAPGGHSCTITQGGTSKTSIQFMDHGRRVIVTSATGQSSIRERCERCGGHFLVQDEAGRKYDHLDSADGLTHTFRDPLGRQTVIEDHPEFGSPVRWIDLRGGEHRITYNEAGDPTLYVDPLGRKTRYSRDPNGDLSTLMIPGRGAQKIDVNELGFPVRTTEADGSVTEVTYDGIGRPARIVDADGAELRLVHDAAGQIIQMVDPAGAALGLKYSDLGQLAQVADPAGRTTTFEYDGRGLMRRIKTAGGRVVDLSFDVLGLPKEVRIGDQELTRFSFDQAGRLQGIGDAAGTLFKTTLNASGQATALELPDGSRMVQEFDSGGRLLSRTDPGGRKTDWAYGSGNEWTSITASDGSVMKAGRDKLGRLTSVTDPLGRSCKLEYHENGKLMSWTSSSGPRLTWAYDAQGRMTEVHHPVRGPLKLAYTPAGRLVSLTVPDGPNIRYQWDPKARSVTETRSDGTRVLTRFDESQRKVEEVGPTYHHRWEYAGDGALIRETDVTRSRINSYEYDGQARLVRWTDPQDRKTSFIHDAFGRVAEIHDRLGDRVKYRYDKLGRRVERIHSLGLVTKFEYDGSGNLTGVAHSFQGKATASFGLRLDARGAPAAYREGNGAWKRVVTDAVGRIEKIEEPGGGSITQKFDPMNNLVETEREGKKVQWTYDTVGRPISAAGRQLEVSPQGHVTSIKGSTETTSLSFSATGSLTSARSTRGEVKFIHGPDRRLLGWDGPEGSRRFDHERSRLVREEDSSGKVIAEFSYGVADDEVVSMVRDGKKYLAIADHLGSIRQLLDEKGQVVREEDYDLYGRTIRVKGRVACALGYIASLREPTTALYHLGHRAYSPELALFLQSDPLDQGAPYGYCEGNPLTWKDPSGGGILSVLGTVAAAVAGTVAIVAVGAAATAAAVAAISSAPIVLAGAAVGAAVGAGATAIYSGGNATPTQIGMGALGGAVGGAVAGAVAATAAIGGAVYTAATGAAVATGAEGAALGTTFFVGMSTPAVGVTMVAGTVVPTASATTAGAVMAVGATAAGITVGSEAAGNPQLTAAGAARTGAISGTSNAVGAGVSTAITPVVGAVAQVVVAGINGVGNILSPTAPPAGPPAGASALPHGAGCH